MVSAFAMVKFLHVLFAILAVGANATYGIWIARAAREPKVLPHVLRGVKILDDYVANPSYVLLLVTGLIMVVGLHAYAWTNWLRAGVALWLVAAILGFGVYTPTLRKQIALLDSVGTEAPAYKRVATRGTVVGIVLAVVVIVIVFLMVTKPDL